MQANISINIFTNDFSEQLGAIELADHGEFPLALTWSTGDFTDITKRSGSFSKTFKVSASQLNSRILAYIYEVGVNFYKLHATCQAEVLYNNIPFFKGKLKVNGVSQDNQPTEFDLELIGENLEWVDYLKNHSIRDIDYGNKEVIYYNDDLSELANYNPQVAAATTKSHPLTEGYAIASWNNFPDKFDYVYGLKSYGAWKAGNIVTVDDLRPDVSIAHILIEGFRKAGYRFDSVFCSSNFFKGLVLAFTGKAFSKAANANDSMLFKSIMCPAKEFKNFSHKSSTGYVIRPINDCAGSFDNGNNYAVDRYTVPGNSVQRFQVAGKVVMNNWYENLKYLGIGIARLTANGIVPIKEVPFEFDGNGITLPINIDTDFIHFSQGEEICVYTIVETHNWSTPNISNKSPRFKITELEFFNEVTGDIIEGVTYEVSQVLPEIKLIDVLTAVMNMFNLYFKTDSINKVVYCEPRDEFLKPLNMALDWTQKFDLSKPAEIEYLDDYKRSLTFKYKLDTKDAFLKHQAEITKKQQGSLAHTLPDKFNPGTQDLGVKNFAYTLTFQDQEIIHSSNPTNAGPEMPRLWKDLTPYPEVSHDFTPRILFYEGAVRKSLPNKAGVMASVSWNFGHSHPYRNKYPSLVAAPLNFGTAGGLVNSYYKNTLAQIEDSRQVVAYFKLNLTDILNLDLQRPIYINHTTLKGYYYITTLSDYRPAKDVPVKVTLLPVLASGGIDIDLNNQVDYSSSARLAPSFGPGSGNAALHGNVNLGEILQTPSTVLHNGTGNWAPSGSASIAIGQGVVANARNQTVLGAYNVISPTDIIQMGGGSSAQDRYRALTFTQDGNFLVQGGYLYTSDGREIMFASQRNEQGQPKRFDKLHLKGDE
nr:hypothetical protein [Cytophagales bacterium]